MLIIEKNNNKPPRKKKKKPKPHHPEINTVNIWPTFSHPFLYTHLHTQAYTQLDILKIILDMNYTKCSTINYGIFL